MNKKIDIVASCYKYAPEQFKAYYKIENSINKNIPYYEQIDLTSEQRQNFGYQFICGSKKWLEQLKHDLRKTKKQNGYFTYGFLLEDKKSYAYLKGFSIDINADLQTRYKTYKKICEQLEKQNWLYEISTTANLNGKYQIENVEHNNMKILKNCLVRIYNKSEQNFI